MVEFSKLNTNHKECLSGIFEEIMVSRDLPVDDCANFSRSLIAKFHIITASTYLKILKCPSSNYLDLLVRKEKFAFYVELYFAKVNKYLEVLLPGFLDDSTMSNDLKRILP
ncbi:hypothetical protein CEXT_688911 [Caerostris extrusa]|uniref:Uncharacterized protein n=1 Tax=Caerostris extrusa TaxID=172846 RepID=A0AAV4P2N2_CAEEX|nr:hypothetical protein CEXT_688911 [Caerostris extrusa]